MWSATIEPGLPVYGEASVHLHAGTPTPWPEGLVVRFLRDGHSWVANANPDRPADWRYLTTLATGYLLDTSRARVFIATYTDVMVADSTGAKIWNKRVAIDGVKLVGLQDGILHGRACMDPPDDWSEFRLRVDDGGDA